MLGVVLWLLPHDERKRSFWYDLTNEVEKSSQHNKTKHVIKWFFIEVPEVRALKCPSNATRKKAYSTRRCSRAVPHNGYLPGPHRLNFRVQMGSGVFLKVWP